MKIFYMYLHARKNGDFFYVGKGDWKRTKQFTKRNVMHTRIVAKDGRENISIFAFECTSEADAFESEIAAIKQLRKEGYDLANFTDGGEGSTGAVKSAEARANLSAKLKGKVKTAEHIANQSFSQRSRVKIPENEIARGLKISESHKRRIVDPIAEALRVSNMVIAWRLRVRNPEVEAAKSLKLSASATARLNTPEKLAEREAKAATLAQIKLEDSVGAAERRAASYVKHGLARRGKKLPPASAETRAKRAAARTGTVHTEETKAKMSVAHKGRVRGPQTAEHKAKLLESNAKSRLLRNQAKTELKCASLDGLKHFEEKNAILRGEQK